MHGCMIAGHDMVNLDFGDHLSTTTTSLGSFLDLVPVHVLRVLEVLPAATQRSTVLDLEPYR